MSIALMTEVWRLDMAPTDKMVLLALADAANDSGVCWTPVRSREAGKLDLLTKCSLSERAIQGAIKRLCAGRFLSRIEKPGKGVIYTVTPAADAPRTTCAPQMLPPAANSEDPRSRCGETVRNPKPISEAKASSIGRATPRKHFVPDGWVPTEAHTLKAQTLGLDLHEQAEAFREFEFDKPKANFDLAFHRWLRNARNFAPRAPNARSSNTRAEARSVWSDIAADEDAARSRGDGPHLRLAG